MADDGFNATVDCPDFDESGSQLLEDLGYWMEGIAQCSIAVLGIMFNIGSSLVLASRWVTNDLTMGYGKCLSSAVMVSWMTLSDMEHGGGEMISAPLKRVIKMSGPSGRNFY